MADVAGRIGLEVPEDLRRHKGWLGHVAEWVLGADAGSKPAPDFEGIGVELKTVPIDAAGKPLESTYVCLATSTNLHDRTWETSLVRKKLAHVMWLPVVAQPGIPLAERRFARALIAELDPADEAILQSDWAEIVELIKLGMVEAITGSTGELLQLRPKAASGRVRVDGIGEDGFAVPTRPRAFYLRTHYTRQLFARHFALPSR